MHVKTEEFVRGEAVWIRSFNMKKAGAGLIDHLGVDSANGQEWAEIALFTDYFDWDHDLKLVEAKDVDSHMIQVPLYRLEKIKW